MSKYIAGAMQNRIRQIRRAKDMGLVELADRAGISAGYLSQIETGKRQLNANRIETIARALNCSPIDILDIGEQSLEDQFSAHFGQLNDQNKKIVQDMIAALLTSQE